VIRFSAGLVVVALGVLIGGVATSKLSLVYVSIAVSVLALIAWAIGVFLKRGELREELFGGRPELVPAGAGVGAGLPAPERSASAPQSPQDRPAHGRGGLDAAAFSSPAQVSPTWRPKEPEPTSAPDRAAAPAGGWGSTSTPPSGTPSVAPRGLDGAKEPPAPPSAPAGTGTTSADAGSAGAQRSWFDRLADTPADAPAPADAPSSTDAPSITDTDTSGDVDVPADEDDDWPTRYSWLDDEETDEAVESDEALKPDEAVESVLEASELAKPPSPGAQKSPEVNSDAPAEAHSEPEDTDAENDAPASPSATDTDLGRGDSGEAEPSAEAEPTAEDEQSDEDEPLDAKQESGARLVTVVPGVPRYHEPDCILIRFMPSGDVQTKSIPEAKAAKCTPCAACQPED
jgi:hypothetical protein